MESTSGNTDENINKLAGLRLCGFYVSDESNLKAIGNLHLCNASERKLSSHNSDDRNSGNTGIESDSNN
jgi:hypothetical protein